MSDRARLSIARRPRRLRRTEGVRALVRETVLRAEDLVAPLFVFDGAGEPQAIASMPGVLRYNIHDCVEEVKQLRALGIHAIALFPKLDPSLKDDKASAALAEDGLLLRTVRAVKVAVPEMVIMTDVALDPYTSHGHDGVLGADGHVDNDGTVALLCAMAVLQARAGSDFVAPSDMMDGRVGAIRAALDAAGFEHVGIMAYSAKYASAFYGPFRDAVGSASAAGTHHLDKRTYQLDPANRREAIVETTLDEQEGADMLMVKPAGPYLDIIRELRDRTQLPITAYQVSGEYAQLQAAARLGWLDLERTSYESVLAIKRAGADLIFTYFAKALATRFVGEGPRIL